MPSIEFNLSEWSNVYDWKKEGEEWSAAWGGSYMQWMTCLLPRIGRYISAECILEIACGYGRWTEYLRKNTDKLIGVDLSPNCIDFCNERFKNDAKTEFILNDGKSLEFIPDESVDFVFSFDSLVHVDNSILDSYISQLPRILKKNGVCFLHHSNFGQYSSVYNKVRKIPKLLGLLGRAGVLERNTHLRDPEVTFQTVQSIADKYGLGCLSQEIITWGTKKHKIDCLTLLTKNEIVTETKILHNPNFMKEVANSKLLSQLYNPL